MPDLDEITAFCAHLELLDAADAVMAPFELQVSVGRHLHFRLRQEQGESSFIKRPLPGLGDRQRALAAELQLYVFCQEDDRAAPLAEVLASRRATVPHERSAEGPALVLELLEDAEEWWRESARHLGPARALGSALGTLHKLFRSPELRRDPRLGSLPTSPPTALSLHRPSPTRWRDASRDQLRWLRQVQGTPALVDGVDRVRAGWRTPTLIHGDLRSSNVLVLTPDGGGEPQVRLIDWELTRWGDPAWDLAGVLAHYGCFPAPAALRQLWRSYRAAAELEGATAAELLERAVAQAAVWRMQTAWELAGEDDLQAEASERELQAAGRIFADPESARRELFGLGR